MKAQYPFFRDPDERTQAVLGESAAGADLESSYQKPYAILTQKRLYCKNDLGNYITENSDLRSAGVVTVGRNILTLVAFLYMLVVLILQKMLSLSFFPFLGWYYRIMDVDSAGWAALEIIGMVCRYSCLFLPILLGMKRKSKILTSITVFFVLYGVVAETIYILCDPSNIVNSFLGLIPFVCNVFSLWWAYKHREFKIQCAKSSFSFDPAAYSAQELKQFTKAVKVLAKSGR